MQVILSLTFIYIISTIVGQNMRIFTLDPKLIHIQSPSIYALLIFPYSFIGNKTKIRLKDRNLMLSELIFCICNQIILVGSIILQIIPSIPCTVIEITFGHRYRGFDIILDTYNQKIPLVALLAIVGTELLVLFGEIMIRAIRNAELRKKLGVGILIGIFVLWLLLLAGLIFSICLLF